MNEYLYEVWICFLAGAGAGIGTGFAGMSAAAVITPMLVTFLGVDAYNAIGIALASDVLASAASAYTYAKNRTIDIRNGLVMMVSVLIMTAFGSFLSSLVPSAALGNTSVLMVLFLGLKFLIFPVTSTRRTLEGESTAVKVLKGVLGGSAIGLVCGFFGAGGGMMMLMVLTMVLGYELKTAVGTSVFIMTFSALTGAVSHFALGSAPRLDLLLLCVISSCIVFEKIKEEYALGKKIHLACRGGIKRSLWPILDSHFIVILASAFIWIFAPSALKIFGITLIIGALISMFASLVILKYLIKLYLPINSTNAKVMRIYREKNVKENKEETVVVVEEEVATPEQGGENL